jgi:hypothetical protein
VRVIPEEGARPAAPQQVVPAHWAPRRRSTLVRDVVAGLALSLLAVAVLASVCFAHRTAAPEQGAGDADDPAAPARDQHTGTLSLIHISEPTRRS